ncbi:MAG TPA: cysteine synthase A [Eubacteriales bacterium]|nr:cysteine synthase A [Eubacteriales bacterium]
MIYESAVELIGQTPLFHARRFAGQMGVDADIVVKLESRNPGGSAKDRIAFEMIEAAERRGALKPGATLIEATSGNTGVGLGVVAAVKGYHVILTMPDTMSIERIKILRALGVEVVLTEGARGMAGANEKAEEILQSTPGSMRMLQFENPDNPAAHEKTTGPEIWADTEGKLDALVAGVGTGGTLCGTGRFLKRKDPSVQVVAVQPEESPVLTGGKAGPHGIQGIGANFVPGNYEPSVVDLVISVPTSESIEAAKAFMRSEGVLCGISGGAALLAAVRFAKQSKRAGQRVVVILPDTGERYLSTELFA